MSRSSRESVEDYLDAPNPHVPSLLRCPDLQNQYRSKNRKLIQVLTIRENVFKVIETLHTTKDFQTARRILGICISPITIFLEQFSLEPEYSERLLELLAKPKQSHRYVFGIIMQILLKAFDTFPDQMIDIFNESRLNYARIVGAIQFPAVFYFASRLVLRNEDVSTFIWVIFASLMDEHGTGPSIPGEISRHGAIHSMMPRLNPLQRQKALEVLCIYFNEFANRSCLYKLVSKALPLMLQDASDDQERALVIRLGLNLEPNEALGYSVLSVVNCFKSSDILLQYSILYISAFNVMIGNKSIEFFVYRLLKRPANNFVLISCASMIRHIIQDVEPNNVELAESIPQIIDYSYANNPLMKSNIMLAFRVELVEAAHGADLDPESNECARKLVDIQKRTGGKYSQSLIDDFNLKDKQIMSSNDEKFSPQFNVKELWKNSYAKNAQFFRSVKRLSHLSQVSSIPRPIAQAQSPKKSPAKRQSLQPSTNNVLTIPKRQTHSDDEFGIDDDNDDDGPHTLDPTTTRKPLYFTDTSRNYQRYPVYIASDDDEEENYEEEEDNFVDLPEVDVVETLPASLRQQEQTPLTDTETLSEPIPTETLAKSEMPIPKLNPESPRSNKMMVLSQQTRLFSDDNFRRSGDRPAPLSIPGGMEEDEEEEYEYIYDYDEDGEDQQQQTNQQRQQVPQKIIDLLPPLKPLPLSDVGKVSTSQPTLIPPDKTISVPTPETPPRQPGTPPSSFLSPGRKDPELEPLDFLLDDDEEEPEIVKQTSQQQQQQEQQQKETPPTSPTKKKVLSPKKSPKSHDESRGFTSPRREKPPEVLQQIQIQQPQISPQDRKYFRLQLDLEPFDQKPQSKPKAVMHRRVLVIEIPERQPPRLFIAPTLSVERPEIAQPLQPQLSPEKKKLTISDSPRVFYSYDDSKDNNNQNNDVDFDGPLEEEIITL